MVNLRQYTKKKEKKKDNNLGQKILKHRLTIFYRTALVLAVIAAMAAIVIIQIKNRVYETYEVISSVERAEIPNNITKAYGGNILSYSRDGASCVDAKGTVLWNQTFEMQNPIMKMAGNKVAFGDYNGSTVYVMDENGPVSKIDTKMPIRNFCVADNGTIAAVLDEGNITWIYVFSSAGKEVAYFKVTMKKSGYPVAVNISPDGTLIQVAFLSIQNGVMDTKVAFYNFNAVGQNKIDNLVSAFDYPNTIVPTLGFFDGSTAFAVADNRIMIYEGAQIPTSISETMLSEEIQAVYNNEKYLGLLYYDSAGEETYRMDIYDKTGKLAESFKFSMDYTAIRFVGDRLLVNNETECLIHNVGGNNIFEGQFDKGVLAMVPTKNLQRYLLVTMDSIDTIELK